MNPIMHANIPATAPCSSHLFLRRCLPGAYDALVIAHIDGKVVGVAFCGVVAMVAVVTSSQLMNVK